jgi:hypothetical protein
MDPVTIIVGVLVKVFTASAATLAQRATNDAYDALKSALTQRYGASVAASINQLERQPNSPQRQAAVAEELRSAGADHDQEIISLANELSRLIDDPTSPEDPIERVQRRAGVRAVGQVMDDHIANVMKVRSKYHVEASDILTAKISRSTDVPKSVGDELTRLHANMRRIIEEIVQRIEDGKYRDAEQAIAGLDVSLNEREQAGNLISADKQLHVSYQTLRMTVEFFSEFNQQILARIEEETSPARQSNQMLGNAIMIYELTDFVIEYIEGFAIGGMDEIDGIYADIRRKIADVRIQQEALGERARDQRVEASVREQTLHDIRLRQEAIDEVDREWASYVTDAKKLDTMLVEVRAKIPTLELIRDSAGVQISLLQLVALLRFLKQNSEAIKGTVDVLQGFKLAPLTSNRVRRLLGIELEPSS